MDDKQSYRSIVKTTSLFGGVEALKIVVGVIQTKVVALLLGPAGVGIQNIFSVALHMLVSFFGFGLHTSAVREIAQSNSTHNENFISKTIITLRRWIRCTAVLGAIFMIVFSKQISEWSFGVKNYAFEFILLSLALVFTIISNGQIALIKGLRRLKDLAKASLMGSFISLLVSIPLYYYFREKAIVPVLIVTALSLLSCSYIYARKVPVSKVKLTFKESYNDGKEMFKIGFFLMLSSFLMQVSSFLINGFISHNGSYDDVGLYRAGYLITAHYVGLVFSAMGADFLPRLSEVNKDNGLMSRIVHQQSSVAIYIIAPMVSFLFPFVKIIINILYSDEFYAVEPYICWAALGLVTRACVWCLSYLLLAKGYSKKYFYTEVFYNGTNVLFCIIGYKFWGLSGMGMGFFLNNVACLLFNFCFCHKYCDFIYSREFTREFLSLNGVVCLFFVGHYFFDGIVGSIVIAVCAVLFSIYCIKVLQTKLGVNIISMIKSKFQNKRLL